MQPTDDRHMQKATVWGAGEIDGVTSRREQSQPPFYTAAMNTGSAEIMGQLVAQTKSWMYTDMPRGPIMSKWIPASPPQAAPGFSGYTDPGLLDPRILPADEFVQSHTGHSHMRSDPWMALRAHVWLIFGMIIVGAVLLQWGHWSYPHSQAEVSK